VFTTKSRRARVAGVLALLTCGAAWAAASNAPTVGWFLNEIAAARHWSVRSPENPAGTFQEHGIVLPRLDPAKPLTEGDAATIGRTLGITVTTQHPAAPLDRDRARTFASTIAVDPGPSQPTHPFDSGGDPNDSSNNGKGKKKGHNKSANEPI